MKYDQRRGTSSLFDQRLNSHLCPAKLSTSPLLFSQFVRGKKKRGNTNSQSNFPELYFSVTALKDRDGTDKEMLSKIHVASISGQTHKH